MGCVPLLLMVVDPFSANHGQTCCAGSRIFVHAKIYDAFLERFTKKAKELKIGDPFAPKSYQCPQVSRTQFDVSRPSVSGRTEGLDG
jgi:aldehyde dehydrogenase (NAD+)